MSSKEDKQTSVVAAVTPSSNRSPDARWTLVQRVVQDESFRRAPRLREFLLFLAEKTLDGKSVELNEHEIAIAVFRRPETFNSADDSIVRSSARQLRTKLHEYFEGPGRDEPLIIDIPKGSYVPEFPARVLPAAIEVSAAQQRGAIWKWVSLGLCMVVVALVWALVNSRRESTSPIPASVVTWLYGSRGQEVNLVLCDSALVVMNAYRSKMLTLDDYIRYRDQEPLPLPSGRPAGGTPPEFPGKRLITSFRDMSFVQRFSELSANGGSRVALKHSRLMQVRDFRAGNHILLGSPWSNPWTTLFEDRLDFRFGEEPTSGKFVLINHHPQEGEQRIYQSSPAQSHNGVSYARIAIVRNLSGQDSVLLVSGLHTESSEGALDAALSPGILEQVKQITKARKPEDLLGTELVLEIRAVDGVVRDTHLIASRVHQKQ